MVGAPAAGDDDNDDDDDDDICGGAGVGVCGVWGCCLLCGVMKLNSLLLQTYACIW